jgi:hypothetical protein
MDPEWLAMANEAVDMNQDRIEVGGVLAAGSRTQEGTGRPLLTGLSVSMPASTSFQSRFVPVQCLGGH